MASEWELARDERGVSRFGVYGMRRAAGESIKGVGILLVVTMIWGTTFVVVKQALDGVSASVLVWLRFALASLLFINQFKRLSRSSLLAGLELGAWLCLCYGTQAVGLQTTSPGRSAFITALFVVLVPLLSRWRGEAPSRREGLAALVALAGVGILSFDGGAPNAGDAITLLCAVGYAGYMMRLEHYNARHDAITLTVVQLLGVTAMASLWVGVDLVALEATLPEVSALPWSRIVYLGVLATAVTTWMQTLGQRLVGPTRTALLYMLEPVWAALFAYVMLGHGLGWRGWLGACAILGATLMVELKGARASTEQTTHAPQ